MMKIFVIKFDTQDFGRGMAVVIANNATQAFDILQRGGKLNGYNR